MAESNPNVVGADVVGSKLPEGVIAAESVAPEGADGCQVFVHYNGPTDQLSGMCTGMALLEPGCCPHPVHQHPEEEFLIIAEGNGVIECNGVRTEVGPGAIMYCAGNSPHGIFNTGKTQMTFYWSKWMAPGA